MHLPRHGVTFEQRRPRRDEAGPDTAERSKAGETRIVDPDGEPGVPIIVLGALAHCFMAIWAGVRRTLKSRDRRGQPSGVVERRSEPSLGSHVQAEGYDASHHDFDEPLDEDPRTANISVPAPTSRILLPDPGESQNYSEAEDIPADAGPAAPNAQKRVTAAAPSLKPGRRIFREAQPSMWRPETFELPPLAFLAEPAPTRGRGLSEEALEQNARLLEGVLEDFGVRGEIINVRPGPVVTLYELEPAPGVKSSRVIGLADDIARSMSAISARVAVVSGRNAIGIELPNQKREVVYLRELLASAHFEPQQTQIDDLSGQDDWGRARLYGTWRVCRIFSWRALPDPGNPSQSIR